MPHAPARSLGHRNKKAGQCPAFKSPCLSPRWLIRALAVFGLFYFPIYCVPATL
jgi:hypothetical protein